MSKVRLEIDEIIIHRPKKSWKLYFVIMIEHPTDSEKMIVATLPSEPIKLTKRHNNSFCFDSEDFGSEGMLVLSRELPKSRELNVHIYLRHTRQSTRNLGKVLENIQSGIGKEATDIVTNIVGTASVPWLVISKQCISLLGRILEKIPDRDFGFTSAFERFGDEFESKFEIDRKKDFSGDASIVYSWSVDQD